MQFNIMLQNKNIQLTKEQEKAVNFFKGVLLLLAVPGAGKTTSIIARNANLILQHNVSPKYICNITFSKAAATEMLNRFKKTFPELDPPHFSTIHSLSYKIVREYLSTKNIPFILLEGSSIKTKGFTKKSVINKIYYKINKEYPNDELTEQVCGFISFVRNSLIDLNDPIQSENILNETEELFENPAEIYNSYMEIKKKNNWIDFDDMLCIANNILSTNHLVSKKYREKFKFIQVDEAQDISPVQYDIIKKLSKNSGNLCAIGDDDQTIYSFIGSNPNILLNFKDDFPNTTIIYMERNFRSAPLIVDKCNEFIKGNRKRYAKNMHTLNEFDSVIDIDTHLTVTDQATKIINCIKETEDFNNTAVLYRNNSSALPIILECINQNVPFNINIKKNSVFKQFILDDILAFYTFANDLSNKEAFLNIAYKLNCIYVKKADLTKIVNNTKGDIISELIDKNILKTFTGISLKIHFKHLKDSKNAEQFLSILFHELNYAEYITKKADENSIDILYSLAKDEINIENVILKIAKLLDSLVGKQFEPNGLNLMTLHSSKGLEWKTVHIIDFNDNVIPNEKSDEEEERRLAYVGFSRAVKNLYIHYYLKGHKKLNPSPFIQEFLSPEKSLIANDNQQLKGSKQIVHAVFGKGNILEMNNDIIVVDFDNCGIKKISKSISLNKNLIQAI